MSLTPQLQNNNGDGSDPAELFDDEIMQIQILLDRWMPNLWRHIQDLVDAKVITLTETGCSYQASEAEREWLDRRQEALRVAEVQAQQLREAKALKKKKADEATLARAKADIQRAEDRIQRLGGTQPPAASVAQGTALAAIALGRQKDSLLLPPAPLSEDEQWLSYVWNMPGIEEYQARLHANGSYLTTDLARKWIIDNDQVPPHLKHRGWEVHHMFSEKYWDLHNAKLYVLLTPEDNKYFGKWLKSELASYVGTRTFTIAENLIEYVNDKTVVQRFAAMVNFNEEEAQQLRHAKGRKTGRVDGEASTSTAPAPKRLKANDASDDEGWF
jgi:hypothetical protein